MICFLSKYIRTVFMVFHWPRHQFLCISGDVFIHHSNLLHRSDENHSDKGRRAFLCAYNTKSNSPVIESAYPSYNKLKIVRRNYLVLCLHLSKERAFHLQCLQILTGGKVLEALWCFILICVNFLNFYNISKMHNEDVYFSI